MRSLRYFPTLPSLLAQPGKPFIHRDISWLQFNDRVLAEARQSQNPLFERLKFLSITASNLDEFFMIRMSSLVRSIQSQLKKSEEVKVSHLLRVRSSILESVSKFTAKQTEAFELLTSELEAEGIYFVKEFSDPLHYEIARTIFNEEILPKLSAPEKFTYSKISSTENLQISILFPKGDLFRIPKSLSGSYWRWNEAEKKLRFFFLDDLLFRFLPETFGFADRPGALRLTRDGDVSIDLEEEDSESIPDAVRSGLKDRDKGRPMRLQYSGNLSQDVLDQWAKSLRLSPEHLFSSGVSLYLNSVWSSLSQFQNLFEEKPGLKLKPIQPIVPLPLQGDVDIFSRIAEHDLILHHPYDSFDSYVKFIQQAALDEKVISIEQTVYRVDAVSPVISALKQASEKGKKVKVVIELRARFDELNNLRLTEELRSSGIEVAFGFGKLKLHAKVALVTREEIIDNNSVHRTYTHLSTGNYNAATARQYTDLSLLTCRPEIGADARHFFDSIYEEKIPSSFKTLVAAPTKLHRKILQLIDDEALAARSGKKARIIAKVNSLVDASVIERLYSASCDGVKIDLIVRGACSLVPGVKDLSENIRVISLIDRYLEHSRIYFFENSHVMYLSSADWMQRNFFSRLELAFPILDERIYRFIEGVILPTYLSDTVKAKELTPQGTWKKRAKAGKSAAVRSQFTFAELAEKNYSGTPLERERPL